MPETPTGTLPERKRTAPPTSEQKPRCGIIMPISATANQDEGHWKDVLKLLHRSLDNAGFDPVNVWESSTGDRISERIVSNIFNLDIIVVDISDLNPNVMFELGLRLSSKKPTIVTCNTGGLVPFDIRDFEILLYPPDLNILGIEEFFTKLDKSLKDKYLSYKGNKYAAFLSNVVIDVASPQTRELDISQLLLSRMDDLSRKVSSIENNNQIDLPPPRTRTRTLLKRSTIYVDIPEERADGFIEKAHALYDVDDIEEIAKRNGIRELKVLTSSADPRQSEHKVLTLADEFGGEEGLPF